MGLGIVIPLIVIVVVVPLAFAWAKIKLKAGAGAAGAHDLFVTPSDRLTSTALRSLESPLWRVVYEVAHDKLNGIGHVLVGPPGVFALRTTMEPLPEPSDAVPDAKAIAAAAIARGGVDDALTLYAMSSDRLITVHWGVNETTNRSIDVVHGHTAVDGRALGEWAAALTDQTLTPTQVDLAWQTIVMAIGRPDPLA